MAIAEANSFTIAAEQLGMSRAMASKHLADLEGFLGLRLLNRTTRTVSLTDAGMAYADRCRDILAALDEADREVTSQAFEPVGLLRVSAPMSFGASHVAPLIDQYARRYPRVRIDLVLNDRFVDLIEEGYDLAIRIGQLADSSLIARRIGSARIMICASPQYLAERGRPQVPADLARHECLHYTHALKGNAWTFDGPRGVETVRTGGRLTCNNGDAICQMAIKGLGIVREPDFIVAPFLRSGALELLLADYNRKPAGVYAIHPSHRYIPLKLRTFIDFLAAAIGDHPPWQGA